MWHGHQPPTPCSRCVRDVLNCTCAAGRPRPRLLPAGPAYGRRHLLCRMRFNGTTKLLNEGGVQVVAGVPPNYD